VRIALPVGDEAVDAAQGIAVESEILVLAQDRKLVALLAARDTRRDIHLYLVQCIRRREMTCGTSHTGDPSPATNHRAGYGDGAVDAENHAPFRQADRQRNDGGAVAEDPFVAGTADIGIGVVADLEADQTGDGDAMARLEPGE